MSEQDYGSIPPTLGQHRTFIDRKQLGIHAAAVYAPCRRPAAGLHRATCSCIRLSENTACALAYITFIPAIIFLLVPPYNASPRIKFHAIQELD